MKHFTVATCVAICASCGAEDHLGALENLAETPAETPAGILESLDSPSDAIERIVENATEGEACEILKARLLAGLPPADMARLIECLR